MRRLIDDGAAERETALLRVIAAVLAALSGAWLMAVTNSWLLRATGVASMLFAVLWARGVLRRTWRTQAGDDYLEIGEHHLTLFQHGHARSIPLASIRSVAIDEDRLEVVLALHDGEPLTLEPCYRGVGLHELARLIHDAAFAKPEDASGEIMATIADDE